MATGVETAGLALASFGLVMSGLKGLINGLDTMSAMRRSRYTVILERFARDIEGQFLNLRDICTNLLEGTMTNEEIDLLIHNKPGKLWTDSEIEEALKRRFDDQRAKHFVQTVSLLADALVEMREKLHLDDDVSVSPYRTSHSVQH